MKIFRSHLEPSWVMLGNPKTSIRFQLRDGAKRHRDVWLSPATRPDHSHRPGGQFNQLNLKAEYVFCVPKTEAMYHYH